MKNVFGGVIVILLTFSSSTIWGGVIELDNGSKIIGKIEKIYDGKVHIKTDFAGTLEIDLARVANMVSDEPLFVAFKEGNRLDLLNLVNKINADYPLTRSPGSVSLGGNTLCN